MYIVVMELFRSSDSIFSSSDLFVMANVLIVREFCCLRIVVKYLTILQIWRLNCVNLDLILIQYST